MVGPWMGGLGGKMVVMEHLVEEDRLRPRDQHTMEEVRKMADSVSPMIQLEEDYCSKHSDNLLPILDLKVHVQKEGQSSKLFYKYYRKPMANWQVMPAKSAMPASIKRTSLTQYGL